MNAPADDWLKERHVPLRGSGDGAGLLAELKAREGILSAGINGQMLRVRYTLQHISLAEIETTARASGFRTAGKLPCRVLRALYRYCEEIQLDSESYEAGWDSYVRTAYMSRYRSRRHGRIDDRPQQWRRYMQRRKSPPG